MPTLLTGLLGLGVRPCRAGLALASWSAVLFGKRGIFVCGWDGAPVT